MSNNDNDTHPTIPERLERIHASIEAARKEIAKIDAVVANMAAAIEALKKRDAQRDSQTRLTSDERDGMGHRIDGIGEGGADEGDAK